MRNIQLDLSKASLDIHSRTFEDNINEADLCLNRLINKRGIGSDFTGWIDLPDSNHMKDLDSYMHEANRISKLSQIVVVIGIGGSYLGAKAVLNSVNHHFSSLLDSSNSKHPYILFAGNSLSSFYLKDLLDVLDKKDYSVVVVSKSGTTTEPAIAFRIIRQHLESKYGEQHARDRMIVITDRSKGALKTIADHNNIPQYIVPDDVGGRYSVLSPVGLLPIAIGGANIYDLMKGANSMRNALLEDGLKAIDNMAIVYAVARNYFYSRGKKIELLINYEPSMQMFAEWWKQLFGESEGKNNKGIFPGSMIFTTDLHSMGQYIQDGERNLFETVISFDDEQTDMIIPFSENDDDQLNYIAGKTVGYVNKIAEQATSHAHQNGGVDSIRIVVPKKNEYYLGQLMYFFELSCAISGYMQNINPFDQPGVEAYKKKMFSLLGKPSKNI